MERESFENVETAEVGIAMAGAHCMAGTQPSGLGRLVGRPVAHMRDLTQSM